MASLAGLMACSGDGGSVFGEGNGGSAAAAGAAGAGGIIGTGGSAAGSSGGAGGKAGGPSACSPEFGETGCTGTTYAGEQIPLDIYIMFDQSCSMSCPAEQGGPGLCCTGGPNPRIDHVRAALDDFLNAPESAGIGVGIGYFGYMEVGNTSCNPADYAVAEVEIAPLPGNAQAILNSVNGKQPTGETPTGAALRGACSYAGQWKSTHRDHAVVILLVTDGVPEAPVSSQSGGCNPTIGDASQAARDCLQNDPSVPVYVLGVGQALQNLNQIAQNGGTDQAHIVAGGDITAEVLAALNAIRADAAIPCQLSVPSAPAGQSVDYGQVNIAYCDAADQSTTFYYVETQDRCDPALGGWYYDNPAAPTQILLCDRSCGTVSQPGGSLLVAVGCGTIGIPR
jgi:hypothetical protein